MEDLQGGWREHYLFPCESWNKRAAQHDDNAGHREISLPAIYPGHYHWQRCRAAMAAFPQETGPIWKAAPDASGAPTRNHEGKLPSSDLERRHRCKAGTPLPRRVWLEARGRQMGASNDNAAPCSRSCHRVSKMWLLKEPMLIKQMQLQESSAEVHRSLWLLKWRGTMRQLYRSGAIRCRSWLRFIRWKLELNCPAEQRTLSLDQFSY